MPDSTTHEALRARWDVEKVKEAVIYPQEPMEEPDALERLLALFDELSTFYRRAAEERWAAIVDFRA